jgi:glycosyltransferase involved in cell wall biosynthesis
VSESPLRVAMIGQKGWPPVHGGIERHVAELATRLAARGILIDIYSRPHYSAARGEVAPGIRVRRLPSIPTKHLDAITHSALATLDVLARRVDVVHYHALGPGLLAGLPRWVGRRATVVTVHGLDWQREKWGPVARAVLRCGERACVRQPHRTIVVSRALQDHFRERRSCETVLIPNGIAPPVHRAPHLIRERGVPERYVLFVGRLVPEKGCHLLTAAWARLPAEIRRGMALVIAGDAGFTDAYARRLRAEASPDTLFLGYVHGEILDELYTNAELVALPSTLEGLSIALLEGMSYGRCCLVSDIPPNREAAGSCARLFPSGDVATLGRELASLLADPGSRARLGAAARSHALENYSWDRAADQTAALYRELLASRAAGAGRKGGRP